MRGFYFTARDMYDRMRDESGNLVIDEANPKGMDEPYWNITIKVPKRLVKGIDISTIGRWTPLELVLPHEVGGNVDIPRVQLLNTILAYLEDCEMDIRDKLKMATMMELPVSQEEGQNEEQ